MLLFVPVPASAQLIIAGYFLVLVLIAFVRKKTPDSSSDFILAGRRVTLFPFVATLVSTMYGWVLGIGELYAQHGVSAWLFLSLPYSLFSLVFALFYAKKAREGKFTTLSDLLRHHYGNRVATIGTMLILLLTAPAMYLLMTAQVLHFIWGWNMVWCIGLATLFSGGYILKGGFKTVVKTDLLQFIFMFAGFATIVISLFVVYGLSPLQTINPDLLRFHLPQSYWYIGSWFLFAAVVLVDPNYHQRIYSVNKPATAQKGLVISVLCWTLFDFLAATAALYALSLLQHSGSLFPSYQLYLIAGQQFLSPVPMGLFFTGLLATIVSTGNSFLFTSAISISKDLLHANKKYLSLSIEQLTRFTLMAVGVANALLCVLYKDSSVVAIFFDFTPYVCAGLLIPVLFSYTRFKIAPSLVFWQMLLSVSFTYSIKLYRAGKSGLWEEVNEVYFGVCFALLFHLVILAFVRHGHFSGKNPHP
ncbi:MAG: hypothetical protein K1X81_05745 [Bacteroidia bacterium]|nr:hypothetical protein [Bacteroidia bacterium]